MAKAKKKDPKELRLEGTGDERKDTCEEISGKLLATSALQAAMTLGQFANDATGTADLTRSMKLVEMRSRALEGGILVELEGMLANQATALGVIFSIMARRSALNMGDYLGATEAFMKLVLKAQAQCGTTVAALAEIKNPKAVYISGQANISNGPQQVSNHTRGTETDITPNKLSEGQANELHQGTGAQCIEGRANQPLETV